MVRAQIHERCLTLGIPIILTMLFLSFLLQPLNEGAAFSFPAGPFGNPYELKPRTDMGEKCLGKGRIFLYVSKIISLIQFIEGNTF